MALSAAGSAICSQLLDRCINDDRTLLTQTLGLNRHMSKMLNHYALFPALTLFALSGLQLPIMAAIVQVPIPKQKSTLIPFHAQSKILLVQAGSNCRMIKNGGGALYTSSSGTESVTFKSRNVGRG